LREVFEDQTGLGGRLSLSNADLIAFDLSRISLAFRMAVHLRSASGLVPSLQHLRGGPSVSRTSLTFP